MDKTLDKLIQFISKNFPFHGEKYPDLKNADEQMHFRFGLKHVVLHMSKVLGSVARASEKLDHGKEFDLATIRSDVTDTVINGLKLAELLGVSGEEIIKEMENKYHDKIEDHE